MAKFPTTCPSSQWPITIWKFKEGSYKPSNHKRSWRGKGWREKEGKGRDWRGRREKGRGQGGSDWNRSSWRERRGNIRITGAGEASETGPGEGTVTAQEQLERAREQRIPNAPVSASVESPLNSVLGPSSASEPGLQAAAQGIVMGPPAPQPPLHYPPQVLPRHQGPAPLLPQGLLHPLHFHPQGLHLLHHLFLVKYPLLLHPSSCSSAPCIWIPTPPPPPAQGSRLKTIAL